MHTHIVLVHFLVCSHCLFKFLFVDCVLVDFFVFCNFRIHRSVMSSVYNGLPQSTSHSGCSYGSSSLGITFASQISSTKALHSWVYPQSSLPSSLISVLTSSATDGGLFNEPLFKQGSGPPSLISEVF